MNKNEITEDELKELDELTKFVTEPEDESTPSGNLAEEDDLDALLAELEGEIPDSGAAAAPSQAKAPEQPVEDKPEPPAVEDEPVKPQETGLEDELMAELGGSVEFGALDEHKPEPSVVEDEPVKPQDTDLEDELMAELGGAVDFGTADEQRAETPGEDEPEPPTEKTFAEPAEPPEPPTGQDELDELDEMLAEFEGEAQESGAAEEPEPETPVEVQPEPPVKEQFMEPAGAPAGQDELDERGEEPTPPPAPARKKKGKKPVIIGIVAALCLCAIGFGAWHMISQQPAPEGDQTATSETTESAAAEPTTEPEVTTEPSEPQNKDNEETASVTENADKVLHIPSWDLDFSNSTVKNDDGTRSFDNIILVHNDSDKDITGFAYNVKNNKGDFAKNKDPNVKDGSPFYAEGFVPAGKNGIMVSKMTVTKDEYDLDKENRLKHRNQMAKAEDNDVEITDVYLFKGKDGYKQATGKLDGSYKDGDHSIYVAKIDNNGNTTVHNGAKIVAVKIGESKGHDSIKVSSAKGVVDRDIEAGSTGVIVGNAFKDPGLGDWPAEDYQVYVIDNKYDDGSTYADAYLKKYAK